MRKGKGKSVIVFADDYCVVDIETTGLDFSCDIIEISALKVRNGMITDKFTELVNPGHHIPEFVTELTGISDDMVEGCDSIEKVISRFNDFVSSDLIVGHNVVSFDANFLYDSLLETTGNFFSNDLVDTMRIARWILPELEHHRLADICSNYKIDQTSSHRGLSDCESTYAIYNSMKKTCIEKYSTLENFYNYVSDRLEKKYKRSLRASDIHTDNVEFDISNPLYGALCVFTGTLEKMPRREAMQIVKDLGGDCGDSVTKKTNFLILGNNDFCKSIKGGKSSKQKKAEKLQLDGNDIQIISENVFYEMANIE